MVVGCESDATNPYRVRPFRVGHIYHCLNSNREAYIGNPTMPLEYVERSKVKVTPIFEGACPVNSAGLGHVFLVELKLHD